VEYEDRRDADEAYHEMHNKRIGRDDILKIEVSRRRGSQLLTVSSTGRLTKRSGLAHLLVPVGDLIAASVIDLPDVRRVVVLLALVAAPATTLLARMIAVTGTATAIVTLTVTAVTTAATPATVLAAPLIGRWLDRPCLIHCLLTKLHSDRDREMKDVDREDRDDRDRRENGDDRKREHSPPSQRLARLHLTTTSHIAAESPDRRGHDDLDVAE
jgi:hypothetical protein